MEKFSLEFKKVVSEKYLEGELSLKSVARMYGISPCTVRKWAYAYREHGISILTGKKGRYSAELKLTVVKEVVDDCFSVREVAVKHRIPAFGTVCNRLEKYRKYGEDAFIRKNKKSIPVPDKSAISAPPLPTLTKDEREELEQLRVENAYSIMDLYNGEIVSYNLATRPQYGDTVNKAMAILSFICSQRE